LTAYDPSKVVMWLARAIEMRHRGFTLVAPGVQVWLKLNGVDHTAVAYGGHAGMVDQAAIVEAVRAVLADWPVLIEDLKIVTSPNPRELSLSQQAELARADDRRAARAHRPGGTSSPPRKAN
jgi:hypothetical protein